MILSPLNTDHGFELPTLSSLNLIESHCPAYTYTTKLELAFYSYRINEFISAYDKLINDITSQVKLTGKQKNILDEQTNRIKKTAKLYFMSCNQQVVRNDVKSTDLYERLDSEGAASLTLPSDITDKIKHLLRKDIEELKRQKDRKTRPSKYDSYDRMKILSDRTEIVDLIKKAFKTCGVVEKASKYNRNQTDLDVQTVALHYAKPSDTHHNQTLSDIDRDVLTKSFHMDPKWNVIKAIVYLDEVTDDNGPFTVIPGSNRWHYNEFERVIAAGNSVGNYLSSPDHRYVMSCFPEHMTKNVIMGNYFDDGSPQSNLLLSKMHQYTSDQGDCIIFDPAHTIHRGGLCTGSDRVNLQVIMR